ncbi:hypothetical protein [Arcanobacterium ihumii]|uniref:hypothetical protein n=1 Tax=Arcanobacterium ihumii TaxID=2138162 RepID=UPI000F52253A|nr:hypothetical protein [Arcanobacterium ihumii]
MKKTVAKVLLGGFLGALTSLVGAVVQAGPVNLPWLGLVLAAALVAAGTWFSYEIGKFLSSFSFALTMCFVTIAVFFLRTSNDVLALAQDYRAHAWILGSVVVSVLTMIGLDVASRRSHAKTNQLTIVSDNESATDRENLENYSEENQPTL